MELKGTNPIANLISDEVYLKLASYNLLSSKGIRDYKIREQFKALRLARIPASEAIEQIRQEHPYLQFDTVRKIVYRQMGTNLDLIANS